MPAHQLQGELAIPVHTYMQSCPHTHAPGGAKVPLSLRNRAKRSPHARTRWRKHPCKKRGPVLAWSLLLGDNGVFTHEKTVVVLQQSFKYFVLPKALKPYKKMQKCQKLLANLGSEDTV